MFEPISLKKVKFDAIEKKAIKWTYGRKFDHYKDTEYFDKHKVIDIYQKVKVFSLTN